MRSLNTNQKDGIAKVLDTIGTANVVAVLVGSFSESTQLSLLDGLILMGISLTCIVCATLLRR